MYCFVTIKMHLILPWALRQYHLEQELSWNSHSATQQTFQVQLQTALQEKKYKSFYFYICCRLSKSLFYKYVDDQLSNTWTLISRPLTKIMSHYFRAHWIFPLKLLLPLVLMLSRCRFDAELLIWCLVHRSSSSRQRRRESREAFRDTRFSQLSALLLYLISYLCFH